MLSRVIPSRDIPLVLWLSDTPQPAAEILIQCFVPRRAYAAALSMLRSYSLRAVGAPTAFGMRLWLWSASDCEQDVLRRAINIDPRTTLYPSHLCDNESVVATGRALLRLLGERVPKRPTPA